MNLNAISENKKKILQAKHRVEEAAVTMDLDFLQKFLMQQRIHAQISYRKGTGKVMINQNEQPRNRAAGK